MDTLSLGLDPIYQTLTSANYTSTPVFLTIFAFLTELKLQAPGNDAAINTFAAAQSVNGIGIEGTGETVTGGIARALPLFKPITVNGGAVQVCSIDDAGQFNKLGNREYLKFTVTTTGSHTLTMICTSGAASRDPDFYIYRAGTFINAGISGPAESETLTLNLTAGDYLIDTTDDRNSVGPTGDACYNFTITG
jgi:hypothetical protein